MLPFTRRRVTHAVYVSVVSGILLVLGERTDKRKPADVVTSGPYLLQLFNSTETFDDALQFCDSMSSWLVEVKTSKVLEDLKELTRSYSSSNFWVGGHSRTSEWSWTDNTSITTVSLESSANRCLVLKTDRSLKSNRCDSTFYFVCQTAINTTIFVSGYEFRVSRNAVIGSEAAKSWCSAWDESAHLGDITSREIDEAINDELTKRFETSLICTGGNDLMNEGKWVWSNGTKITGYTNWKKWPKKDEPNGKTTENCLFKHQDFGWEWVDWRCRMWAKALCQKGIALNRCSADLCSNRGQCVVTPNLRGMHFKCSCNDYFLGRMCEIGSSEKDWCIRDGIKDTCKENSHCINDYKLQRGVCQCDAGFRGNATIGCVRYCIGSDIRHEDGTFYFELSDVGTTAYAMNDACPDGRSKATAVCKFTNAGVTEFVDLTVVSCDKTIHGTITTADDRLDTTPDYLEKDTATIQLLTSNSNTKVARAEVEEISDFVERVSKDANENSVSSDTLGNVLKVVDNLIRSDSLSLTGTPTAAAAATPGNSGPSTTPTTRPPSLSAKEQEKQLKRRILRSVNNLANSVEIPEDETSVNFTTASMLVTVTKTPVNKPAVFAPVYADVNVHNRTQRSSRPVNISIPTAALKKAKDENGLTRVSFFLYLDSTLFPSDDYSPGLIVAANVGNDEVSIMNLTEPIEMDFSGEKKKPGQKYGTGFNRKRDCFRCGYWNVRESEWRYDGCEWVVDSEDQLTRCQCNHLTNFALLVATNDLEPNVPLETASVIGLSLSMLGLFLTIIIHATNEDIRKIRPTQILFHICTNLLISNIVFVAGIERNENKSTCISIAILMHYFYLTTWCWMAVYSYDMYRSLVMVFGASISRYMTKCTLFGYGVPLLITVLDVGIAVGYVDRITPQNIHVQGDNYHRLDNVSCRQSAYVAENICWIQNYSLSMGFLVPVAIMLAFNVFVYSMVLRTLYRRGKSVKSSAKKTSAKDKFFISVTLITSTGIAWVFGYLMLLSKDPTYLTAMSWIFAILNTFQGLVIFLSTCVRNENMKRIWLQPLLSCCGIQTKPRREFTTRLSSENTFSTATKGTSVALTTKSSASESTATRGTSVPSTTQSSTSESTSTRGTSRLVQTKHLVS